MKLLGFPMALQFKSHGSGYVYRKDQTGPALPATAAERDAYVGWMGWMVMLGAVLYVAGMIVMAMLADRLIGNSSNAIGATGGIAMAIIALGSLYLFLLWVSHAPARAFVGRAAVEPAISRKQAFGSRLARLTYARIATVSIALSAILLFRTAGDGMAWLAVALPATIGTGLALWKRRTEKS